MRVGILVVALALTGCAENAILELALALPPSGTDVGGRSLASVEVRFDSDTRDFGSWAGQPGHVAVLEAVATQETLSVIAGGDEIAQPLAVRVAFCEDGAGCEIDPAISELHFVFERAFYRGQVTEYALDLASPPDTTPATPTDVGPCEVGGCGGGGVGGVYCREGRHFCEL